jgi:hypothetical protein
VNIKKKSERLEFRMMEFEYRVEAQADEGGCGAAREHYSRPSGDRHVAVKIILSKR